MPKYKITVHRTCFWTGEVEADNEEDARESAMDMVAEGDSDMEEQESGDMHITDCDLIGEDEDEEEDA